MFNNIATLGPKGTFSELATKVYLEKNNLDYTIKYYPSIKKTLEAVGVEAALAILPIENFSEGFVNPVLDYLVSAPLFISEELLLPIQFSLVSYHKDISQIDKVYAQFVAQGQCSEFLEKLHNVPIETTQSNTQAIEDLKREESSAAVIPSHLLAKYDFVSVIENITDHKNNQTRFLLLADHQSDSDIVDKQDYKTSIIVLFEKDRPGYLESILNRFSSYNINLTSIVSRPTGKSFGKYHFFIDLDGHQEDLNIKKALDEIQQKFKVKVLGSYRKHRTLD